jgi:hypothetical protein
MNACRGVEVYSHLFSELYRSGKLHAPWGITPSYQLNWRLNGSWCQYGRFWEQKCAVALQEFEPQFLCRRPHSLVTVPTELHLLIIVI